MDKPSILIGNNRKKLVVTDLRLVGDVLEAREYRTQNPIRIPISDVQQMVVKDRAKGLAIGLSSGLLLGGIFMAMAYSEGQGSSGGDLGTTLDQMIATIFAVAATATGTIVGVTVGHRRRFYFEPRKKGSGFDPSPSPWDENRVDSANASVWSNSPQDEGRMNYADVSAVPDSIPKVDHPENDATPEASVSTRLSETPQSNGKKRSRSEIFFGAELGQSSGFGAYGSSISFSGSFGYMFAPHLSVGLGVTTEDDMGFRRRYAVRAESFYFPGIGGFFLKGGLGYGYYENRYGYSYDTYSSNSTRDSYGVSVSAGGGYAFWLGKRFNITLNAEVSGARYQDGVEEIFPKATMGLYWF